MKKILITGASGFVGIHLIEYLLSLGGYEIEASVMEDSPMLKTLIGGARIHLLNLLEASTTRDLLIQIKPDYVVHLAALSSAGASFDKPVETINNNVVAQINLLEAMRTLDSQPTCLIIGSAEEYGIVDERVEKVAETQELKPISPYAVSKIAQDYLAYQYHLTYKLPIIRVRPFNHVGERQPPIFVLPAFAKQIAEVEAGIRDSVLVAGDLQVIRDFTDVKDMVKAYELALRKCNVGEVYNIGTGRPVLIQDLLDLLIRQANVPIRVTKDESRFRPADVKRLVCDGQKFEAITGWKPEINLEETVVRVLAYWREQVNNKFNKIA